MEFLKIVCFVLISKFCSCNHTIGVWHHANDFWHNIHEKIATFHFEFGSYSYGSGNSILPFHAVSDTVFRCVGGSRNGSVVIWGYYENCVTYDESQGRCNCIWYCNCWKRKWKYDSVSYIAKVNCVGGLTVAMFTLCILIICMILLSDGSFSSKKEAKQVQGRSAGYSLNKMVVNALRDKSYIFLMIGFFTCGFHMAIIETHLFSQLVSYGFTDETAARIFAIYGIAVILGSVISGILDRRFSMKNVLGTIYASCIAIVIMLLVLPKTTLVIYMIAILLGLTAASTVPPTSGLVGKLFGTEKWQIIWSGVPFSSSWRLFQQFAW